MYVVCPSLLSENKSTFPSMIIFLGGELFIHMYDLRFMGKKNSQVEGIFFNCLTGWQKKTPATLLGTNIAPENRILKNEIPIP